MASKKLVKGPTNAQDDVSPAKAPAEAAAAPQTPLRQGNAPVCPICKVVCKSARSDPFFTRYYCPTQDCSYSEKVAKPNMNERIKRQEAKESDFSAR